MPVQHELRAVYSSSVSSPFTVSFPLSSISAVETTPESISASAGTKKPSHLAALRAAVASAQGEINRELTARMEEEKSREADSRSFSAESGQKINGSNEKRAKRKRGEETAYVDQNEEDNYGEEQIDED